MVAQNSADYPIFRGGRGLDYLGNCNTFIKNDIAPAAKKLLPQRLGKLLVDVKISKSLRKMWEQNSSEKNERWKKEVQA